MATNRRLAGVTSAAIDGSSVDLVEPPTYSPSDRKRSTMIGADRVHGYKEEIVPGFIALKVRDSGARAAKTYQAMVNVTVTLTLANGKTVSGAGMWNVEAIEVDTTEGVIALRFEGDTVGEDLAS